MLTVLNDAIEGGRVDLYLQPIVTLPERKLRYYEGYHPAQDQRRRDRHAARLSPRRRTRRLMPIVDNVLLVKSVQLLRELRSNFARQGRILQHLGAVAARSRLLP